MTDFGGSDELRDEMQEAFEKAASPQPDGSWITEGTGALGWFNTGYMAALVEAERRIVDAKAEADRWQERAEVAEARLATVRADMHLTQMTPDPNDPGAYVLGDDAEAALAVEREGESHE